MQRGLPQAEFRLRPKHLIYLVDLGIAVVLFLITGKIYMAEHGSKVIAAAAQKREAALLEFQSKQVEADSVMAAKQSELAAMRADSVAWVQKYQNKRQRLESDFNERQAISGKVFQLAEYVQNMKSDVQQATVRLEGYQKDVADQSSRITSLLDDSQDTASKLDSTRTDREQAREALRTAYRTRTYEPVGVFPDHSGVAVKSEVSSDNRLTSVELQRILTSQREFDLGVALGVGVGTGDRTSSKELGVLFSRPLVHRRLGLDLTAGFEHLTNETGDNQSGAFAAAGLRYSPLYKERLHFGLGAKASDGTVFPYISVALGRR